MAYEKQNFADGQVLTVEQLERMEDGIIGAEEMCAGRITEEGGAIFGDYDSLMATENAAAFGGKIDRSGSNGDPTQKSLDTNPDLWRHSEASQPGALAGGLGAYALARASKSLGYRTQTGYALKKHLKETTFQTAEGEVTAVDPSVVPYVLKDGSYAETYEQIMAENKGSLPGQGAVSIGSDTVAAEHNSFAGGYASHALAQIAFVFGNRLKAFGKRTALFGASVVSFCENTFGANYSNTIRANNAAVFGTGNNTAKQFDENGKAIAGDPGFSQLLCGTYNAYENGEVDDALFAVGNGNSDKDRSNALVVRKDGGAEISGDLKAKEVYANNIANALLATKTGPAIKIDDISPFQTDALTLQLTNSSSNASSGVQPDVVVYSKNLINYEDAINNINCTRYNRGFKLVKGSGTTQTEKMPTYIPANTPFVFSYSIIKRPTDYKNLWYKAHFADGTLTKATTYKLGTVLQFEKDIVGIQFGLHSNTSLGAQYVIDNLQLELGVVSTPYTDYVEPKELAASGNDASYKTVSLDVDREHGMTVFIRNPSIWSGSVSYNRDIVKAFAELQNAIISLGGYL